MCRSMLYQVRPLFTDSEAEKRVCPLGAGHPRRQGEPGVLHRCPASLPQTCLRFGEGLARAGPEVGPGCQEVARQDTQRQVFLFVFPAEVVLRRGLATWRTNETRTSPTASMTCRPRSISPEGRREQKHEGPYRLSACLLTEVEKILFVSMVTFARAAVKAMQQQTRTPPAAIDCGWVRAASHTGARRRSWCPGGTPGCVSSGRTFCIVRSSFGIRKPMSPSLFVIMFCFQSPYFMSVVEMKRKVIGSPLALTGGFGHSHWTSIGTTSSTSRGLACIALSMT